MNEKYDEDMTSVASEMSSLKTQIEEMERKFLTEKNELESSHEQRMEHLRSEMRQEGQDLSEKNVCSISKEISMIFILIPSVHHHHRLLRQFNKLNKVKRRLLSN
jgi:tRNA-dihydrouridine synthase